MPTDKAVIISALGCFDDLCISEPALNNYTKNLLTYIPTNTEHMKYGLTVNTFNRNFMNNNMTAPALALALMKAIDHEPLKTSELLNVTANQVKVKLRTFKPNIPKARTPTVTIPAAMPHVAYRPAPPPRRNLNVSNVRNVFENLTDYSHFVISGHGSLEYDTTNNCWPTCILPTGVRMFFYTPFYYVLSDRIGGQIDRMTLSTGQCLRHYQASTPGGVVYDYTLHAANPHQTGGDIQIFNSTVDNRFFKLKAGAPSIRLSTLILRNPNLKKAMNLHWAACRVVHYKNHWADPVTHNWVTTTQTWAGP